MSWPDHFIIEIQKKLSQDEIFIFCLNVNILLWEYSEMNAIADLNGGF